MQDLISLSALFGAAGSIAAVITFWMNRGKAEADAIATAEAAKSMAASKSAESMATALAAQGLAQAAIARAELVTAQLAEARIEFARDYASHKDLAAAENRSAITMDAIRTELRGMNDRLDRVIDSYRK